MELDASSVAWRRFTGIRCAAHTSTTLQRRHANRRRFSAVLRARICKLGVKYEKDLYRVDRSDLESDSRLLACERRLPQLLCRESCISLQRTRPAIRRPCAHQRLRRAQTRMEWPGAIR